LADKLKAGFGNRILAVEWETGKALEFPVNLYIQGIDTMGILHQIGDIVSEQLNVYIRKIFIETMDGLFEGHIQLYVHDVEDVNTIIANLQKMEEMKKVVRVEQFEDKP
jgi:GTP pyrophosphokinase